MSVFSDAWAERAAKTRGAPIGPRVRPIIRFDEEGHYTVWPDKACSVCGLGLTSRNRYGTSTMCSEHGREHDRNRVRKPRAARPKATGRNVAEATSGSSARTEPQSAGLPALGARLHVALSTWLRTPDADYASELLQSALDDYELRHRLQRLLPEGMATLPVEGFAPGAIDINAPSAPTAASPPTAASACIPVEEVIFDNPNHRTTRLEFLADCSTYAV